MDAASSESKESRTDRSERFVSGNEVRRAAFFAARGPRPAALGRGVLLVSVGMLLALPGWSAEPSEPPRVDAAPPARTLEVAGEAPVAKGALQVAPAESVPQETMPRAATEIPGGLPTPPADAVLRARSQAMLDDAAALFRAARSAQEAEDHAHADWLYAQIADRHPIVGDHAGSLRAQLQLDRGQPAEARKIAAQVLADHAKSPLRASLHELVGDARVAERNEAAAREAWAAALSETDEDARRAALLRKVARSEERSGEDRAAGITWRLLWYAHPSTREADQASHRLDVIEAHLGETLRRASDWRRRGDRLFQLRRNEGALEAYDRALALGLPKSEVNRTRKQRAHTLFRMRTYPEALAAFQALPQTGDTPIWVARSLARADRVIESIAAFEKLAAKPGPNQMRAHYYAGTLLDGRDRDAEARKHFDVLAGSASQGGNAAAAAWRLAWSDYRFGRPKSAAKRFAKLADATSHPIDQLRPRYWEARALEAVGKADEAEARFKAIAEEYPLAYYGFRAREHAGITTPVAARPHSIGTGRSAIDGTALERIRILMAAGLDDAGAEESAELMRRAKGLDDRLALARLLTSAGDFNRAQRVIVNAYRTSLARGPIAGQEELWWYAWPSAFSGLVDGATASEGSVDPELVYSIMREESGYRPKVISPVGARGLLQIMRETGADLAKRSGRGGFDPDDLFDPRTNIELGSFYLAELTDLFPKKLSASIASYNAGPHVVTNWVEGDARPDDEWVESIPYSQTRKYVKRVMRSLEAYRLLY